MIKSLCRDCQKKKAPAKWFTEVDIIRAEIQKVGGELKSVQYVCPDCTQKLFYWAITKFYFQLSTVN